MNITEEITNKEKMAINGWKIWDSIISDISDTADLETMAFFVL